MTPNITYQLAESGGDPRYVQDDNRTNLQTNPLSTGSMTCVQIDANGNVIAGYSDGINGGVSVPLGYSVRCTATNRTAPLILIKHVVNDNGGTATAASWNLTATPTTPPAVPAGLIAQTVPGAETPSAANTIFVRPGQPYTLTESTLAGYTLTGITCVTSVSATPRELTNITLAANESGVCTYVNNDQAPRLTLKKQVRDLDGNLTPSADWTLTAVGSDSTTPINGKPADAAAGIGALVNCRNHLQLERIRRTGGLHRRRCLDVHRGRHVHQPEQDRARARRERHLHDH